MSFESYQEISTVLKEYSISSQEADFIEIVPLVVRDSFREELEFSLREFSFFESEYGVCEAIIFPILREVYRDHRDFFVLWSHKPLKVDQQLTGVPDYILSKRSPLGKEVFEKPFFITVEAKKDNFVKGWGQCLAEMVAIQKINESPQTVYGIVSNGQLWQFGQLKESVFTKNFQAYTVYNLETLLGSLNYIFKQCLS